MLIPFGSICFVCFVFFAVFPASAAVYFNKTTVEPVIAYTSAVTQYSWTLQIHADAAFTQAPNLASSTNITVTYPPTTTAIGSPKWVVYNSDGSIMPATADCTPTAAPRTLQCLLPSAVTWTPLRFTIDGMKNSLYSVTSLVTLTTSIKLPSDANLYSDEDTEFGHIIPGILTDVTFQPSAMIANFATDYLISFTSRIAFTANDVLMFSLPNATTVYDTNTTNFLYSVTSDCTFYEWEVDELTNPRCPSITASNFLCTFTASTNVTDPYVSCKSGSTFEPSRLHFILTNLRHPSYEITASLNRVVRIYTPVENSTMGVRDEATNGYLTKVVHLPCEIGTYFENNRYDGVCAPCQAGKYSNVINKLACDNCQAGKITSPTATGMSQCTDCEVGKYSLNTTYCDLCTPGRYQVRRKIWFEQPILIYFFNRNCFSFNNYIA